MAVKNLEDLQVWQEARKLMKMIYEMVENFPADEKYNIVKHLKECARNIPANIAEAFGRYHYQESMQFYRIVRGSLNEVKSDTYCSLDLGYITEETRKKVMGQIDLVGKMLNNLIISTLKLKNSTSS